MGANNTHCKNMGGKREESVMLKVAIIGTGNISAMHIQGYLAFPERCKIVALCDIYPEKAEAKKAEYGLTDAQVFSSHKDMLGKVDVDLVSVCTPPYVHAEISIDFLNDGKNVICEKPMAASLEECDRMLEAEKKSGKTLAIIAQNRFRNSFMHLKDILDSGKIGKVLHAQVDSFWWRGHCYYDLWWRGSWEKEGGGCTLNHAVHHVDMLGWMMGLPEKVTAVLSNAAHDNAEVEDISIAALQYPGGALATLTSSVIHHGEEQQVIFQGEKARISAPWKVYASLSKENGFPTRNEALEAELQRDYEALPPLPYEGHTAELDNVMAALEAGSRPFIDGKDGRRTIELITAVYKSGFEGRTVSLPLQKDDPFYTVDGILSHVRHFYEKTSSVENLADVGITVGTDKK